MSPVDNELAVVVLAAGEGTRMRSNLPKVLHPLCGKPMLVYLLNAVRTLGQVEIVLVVGHQADQVRRTIGPSVSYVEQAQRLGTGHAVLQAKEAAGNRNTVMVLYGDMPLLESATLKAIYERHRAAGGPLTMLVVRNESPRGFGRIIRDGKNGIRAIVEEADCTPKQLAIQELNPGVYCFDAGWLWEHLPQLPLHPEKGEHGEYFLTDLIAVAVREGHRIADVVTSNSVETLGVNTPEHLKEAEGILCARGLSSTPT